MYRLAVYTVTLVYTTVMCCTHYGERVGSVHGYFGVQHMCINRVHLQAGGHRCFRNGVQLHRVVGVDIVVLQNYWDKLPQFMWVWG